MFKRLMKYLAVVLLSCSIAYAANSNIITHTELQHAVPHFVRVPNGVMEYYDIGNGSPIVLISGYGSNVCAWDWQFIAGLAAQHRVIVFDNRNTGGSVIYSSSYSSADLANDTYALAQVLHLNKPVIIGISMGGMIAQQYAVLHPNGMSKLVLINTAIAGKSVPPSPQVQQELFSPVHGAIAIYFRALKLFFPPEWQSRMALSLLHDRFKSVYLHEKPTAPNVLLEQQALVRAWSQNENAVRQIAQLPMPVLVLNGGQDIVIPPVNSNILLNTIPHAKLLRWAQGGHSMIYQFPYQIANAINNFIAQ